MGFNAAHRIGLEIIPLKESPIAPATAPAWADTCYFTIEAKGQMYERMLQAQSISIYVPSGMHELQLELVAVTS